MIRVLISGLLPFESGKTWLGLSLAKKLIERGAKVGVFKPIAGHNAWYQYSTVLESLSRAILVGEDVVKYGRVVKDIDLEVSNPIDVLLAPLDPGKYVGRDIDEYLIDLENQFKQTVLARITKCSPKSTKHYVFMENISNVSPYLRRVLMELASRLNAIEVKMEDFLKEIKTLEIERELAKCLNVVEQGKDVVLVESFNNAVTPYTGILQYVDFVLIVTPTAVLLYEKVDDIINVLNEIVKKFGEKGFESKYIVSRVKPSEIMYIKPRLRIDEVDEVIDELALKLISKEVKRAQTAH